MIREPAEIKSRLDELGYKKSPSKFDMYELEIEIAKLSGALPYAEEVARLRKDNKYYVKMLKKHGEYNKSESDIDLLSIKMSEN